MIEIKSPSGTLILACPESTYTGGFMSERSVSISASSETPLNLSSGCYVDYRGERFRLDNTPQPTVKKTASTNSAQDAYQYDLKFLSLADLELKFCQFRDIVSADSTLYYTETSDVSFTGNVSYLIARIKACLDAVYLAPNNWTVNVEEGLVTTTEAISGSDISCLDALLLVNSTPNWNLKISVRGRVINISKASGKLPSIFSYGKGNGLYEINRISVDSADIITRLRVYGGETNIPLDYKREIRPQTSAIPTVPPVASGGIMPYYKFTVPLGAKAGAGSTYNIDGTVFSSLGVVDNGTISYLSMNYVSGTTMPSMGRTLVIISGVGLYDSAISCYGVSKILPEAPCTGRVLPDYQYLKTLMLPKYAKITGANVHAVSKGAYSPAVPYVVGDLVGYANNKYYCILNSASGNLPTNLTYFRPWESDYIDSPNVAKYGIREGVFRSPTTFPTIKGITIMDLETSGTLATQTNSYDRVDEILAVSKITTKDVIGVTGESIFYIWIRDIGFNINSYLASGMTASVSITDAPTGLSGYDFVVTNVAEDTLTYPGSKYKLTLNRNNSDNFIVPNINSSFYSATDGVNMIPSGTPAHFIITGIYMPLAYTTASENRLLGLGMIKLATLDSPSITYSVMVDEIEIARNRASLYDELYEGVGLGVYDADLECGGIATATVISKTPLYPRWADSLSAIIFGIDRFSLGIMPAGMRFGGYSGIGNFAAIWTSTANGAGTAYAKKFYYDKSNSGISFVNRNTGASVLPVRVTTTYEKTLSDGTIRTNAYLDRDGNYYNGVKIGNQVWLNSFLKVTKFKNETVADSLLFDGLRHDYYATYNGANTYAIGDCVLFNDGSDSYYQKVLDAAYGISDRPYDAPEAWYRLPVMATSYNGLYNGSYGYFNGDIVLLVSGVRYYKFGVCPTGTYPETSNAWRVYTADPYIVIERLITGLSDEAHDTAEYGTMSVYTPTENLVDDASVVLAQGRLYNYRAVIHNKLLVDPTGGWRVPSNDDFEELENYIGSVYQSLATLGIGDLLKSRRQVNSPFDSVGKVVTLPQYIAIQQLTIKEGFSIIPEYGITLSTKPITSTLGSIANSIKEINKKL